MTTEAGRKRRGARSPLDFTPVPPARERADGWTDEKQRGFIAALAASGSVRTATEAVGMSWTGVYKLKNAPGAESFAAAWRAAVRGAATVVRDVLVDHCVNGVPQDVWHAGARVGSQRKFNHRSMMWLLQHHLPDEYGAAHSPAQAKAAKEAGRAAELAECVRVRMSVDEFARSLGFHL